MRFGFLDAITSATRVESQSGRFSCIGWCTRLFMVKCRRVMKSTTRMATRTITTQRTLKLSGVLSTAASTSQSHGISAYAEFADARSAVTRSSGAGAARSAGEQITPVLSASAEPAYSLTVDVDECYFVRGADGRAYLVSNSSHGSDAFRYLAVAIDKTGARPELKRIDYSTRGIV